MGEQRGPGRHPDTARMKRSKEVNKVVMECYLKRKPVNECVTEDSIFHAPEHRIGYRSIEIRKNGRLSELGIEVIKRKISQEDTEDINVQDVGHATTDENVEGYGIHLEESNFDTQDDSRSDKMIISEIFESLESEDNNLVNFKTAN